MRLARAENAVIMPAFLARVPRLPLDAPLPRQCAVGMPVLEAIEQRVIAAGVPVDSRVGRGRSYRDALQRLMDEEHFDRIIVSTDADPRRGLSDGDLEWLLERAPAEIMILRPAPTDERRISRPSSPGTSERRVSVPEPEASCVALLGCSGAGAGSPPLAGPPRRSLACRHAHRPLPRPVRPGRDRAGARRASETLVFGASALAIVPVAGVMSEATEHLAARSGPGVGGLVNVTFGNAPELIIALFALGDGLHEVVKASVVGSIVGNALLVLGAAMLAGGWRRTRQTFDRTAAQTQARMLMLTVLALALPATLVLARHASLPAVGSTRTSFGHDIERVSVAVAIVLIVTYIAGLFFSLKTHRDLFQPRRGGAGWRLAGAPLGRDARRCRRPGRGPQRHPRGLHRARLAEPRAVAVLHGSVRRGDRRQRRGALRRGGRRRQEQDGPRRQHRRRLRCAGRAGPWLPSSCCCPSAIGPAPMAMVFNGYELAALLAAGLATTTLLSDGESTWFEGVQLLALYAVIGVVFFAA